MFTMLWKSLLQNFICYMERPLPGYVLYDVVDYQALQQTLRPGDILLLEGNSRYSSLIKYLTNSTWSHCGLYVGDIHNSQKSIFEENCIIEAVIGKGVIASPLESYHGYNLRIVRPAGMPPEDTKRVIEYAVAQLGHEYDLKNVFDLLWELLPFSWIFGNRGKSRRLGSRDRRRVICSSLIARAFATVMYPILPRVERLEKQSSIGQNVQEDILYIRHHSLYTPRDFDLSPFFQVVKPTLERGFNYKMLYWQEEDDDQIIAPPL